jgi:hypothetical protein
MTDDDFNILGVKLSYFDEFIKDCGGYEKFVNKSTSEVCAEFLVPLTKSTGLSLCEQLRSGGSQAIGKAEWFISHAWKYEFLDVVEAITLSLRNLYSHNDEEIEKLYIWFDLFSNSQHNTGSKFFHWWESTFMTAIQSMGNVLMVMLPWDNPITCEYHHHDPISYLCDETTLD